MFRRVVAISLLCAFALAPVLAGCKRGSGKVDATSKATDKVKASSTTVQPKTD